MLCNEYKAYMENDIVSTWDVMTKITTKLMKEIRTRYGMGNTTLDNCLRLSNMIWEINTRCRGNNFVEFNILDAFSISSTNGYWNNWVLKKDSATNQDYFASLVEAFTDSEVVWFMLKTFASVPPSKRTQITIGKCDHLVSWPLVREKGIRITIKYGWFKKKVVSMVLTNTDKPENSTIIDEIPHALSSLNTSSEEATLAMHNFSQAVNKKETEPEFLSKTLACNSEKFENTLRAIPEEVMELLREKGLQNWLPKFIISNLIEVNAVYKIEDDKNKLHIDVYAQTGHIINLYFDVLTVMYAIYAETSFTFSEMLCEMISDLSGNLGTNFSCNAPAKAAWEKGIPLHSFIDDAGRYHYDWRVSGRRDKAYDFLWSIIGCIWTHSNYYVCPDIINLPFYSKNKIVSDWPYELLEDVAQLKKEELVK